MVAGRRSFNGKMRRTPAWDAGVGRTDWEHVLERARIVAAQRSHPLQGNGTDSRLRSLARPAGAPPDDLAGYLAEVESRVSAVAADAIARIRGAVGDAAASRPLTAPPPVVPARTSAAPASDDSPPTAAGDGSGEPAAPALTTAYIRQRAAALAAASSAAARAAVALADTSRGDPDGVHARDSDAGAVIAAAVIPASSVAAANSSSLM